MTDQEIAQCVNACKKDRQTIVCASNPGIYRGSYNCKAVILGACNLKPCPYRKEKP